MGLTNAKDKIKNCNYNLSTVLSDLDSGLTTSEDVDKKKVKTWVDKKVESLMDSAELKRIYGAIEDLITTEIES